MDRKRRNQTLSQETSRLKKLKPGVASQIAPGRAGRIIRVYLRNFMCHTNLEISFDLNTNYIIGRNGSGKSAILTALIVGLGGKAKTTNRGTNIKSFIKTGETSGAVEITLSNTGPMAYNPKIYGSQITIIRTFSDTGSSSYKIKDEYGTVVSSALREVNRLVEALNIHVDNPICILNQDVARTFLNTTDTGKLYMMFMKATNLENVKEQYKQANQNKKRSITILRLKVGELKTLENEVKKWHQKYKAFENIKKVENTKQNLELEVVWAQIILIENELANKESKVTESEEEVKHFSELITNKGDVKKTLTENIEKVRQQLLEIRNEEECNQSAMTTKKSELQNIRESIIMKKNEAINIETTIKRKQNDKKTIEEEISKSSDNHKNRLKMMQERDQKMMQAEQKKLQISQLLETAESDLKRAQRSLTLKSAEHNNLSTELDSVSSKVKQTQSRIRSMKTDENNSINVYGYEMKKVLDAIDRHKEQFKVIPKGPIGSYIKLKDKKWALAIEQCIGTGLLMAFCVDNQQDAMILSKIMARVCSNKSGFTIINSKFFYKVHNYSVNKTHVPSDCAALIDTLIVNDPVILNCLIDQGSIERVLLVPSSDLAMKLMSNARYVPKNCAKSFTLAGDLFFPDPSYRTYACKRGAAKFLQVSASDAIRMYENELRTHLENESTVRNQFEAVNRDVHKLTKEIKNLETKCSSYRIGSNSIDREISNLKFTELPPAPNLEILTGEIEEISKIIEEKLVVLEKTKQESEEIRSKMAVVENEYKELRNMSKNLEGRMRPLIDEMNDADLKLRQININAKHQQDKLQQAKEKLKSAQKEFDVKQKYLQKKIDEASKLGKRVKTKRSIETILKELEDINQQIEDIKEDLGDKLMISQTYLRMQEKYDETKSEISKIKDCIEQMETSIESRIRSYYRLSEYISLRVREMFTGVLKIRQFKGTLEIDHEKQTLEMSVIPQHGSSHGTGQTHILSGGERSYSTVAFLHALWQVMEYPFYFLDEFDVFMDKVNRRTVMDILLEHAKEHPSSQFVFLTPQDISNIVGDKNITVHRMADPDRQ